MTNYEISIIGGGTAGWLSALYLTQLAKNNKIEIKIKIVVPSNIPTIGVGEATTDNFIGFLEGLGIDPTELTKNSNGSYKQAIRFLNWQSPGHEYWHPFYAESTSTKNLLSFLLTDKEFSRIFLNVHLAEKNRSPFNAKGVRADGGMHFDNYEIANFLKSICLKENVVVIDSEIKEIVTEEEKGISKIFLKNDMTLESDFFIDATGFRSLLLDGAMKEPFISFSKYLLCDSAQAVQEPYPEKKIIEPYTTATALSSGWAWRIPTYRRIGSGYVHSSEFLKPADAEKEFRNHLNLHDPMIKFNSVKFRIGCHERTLAKNTLGVGLASGFIEPLESTGILFITKTLESFGGFLLNKLTRDEVNSITKELYISTRDFIFLHYRLSQRNDTPFWRRIQELEYPESVKEKLDILKMNVGPLSEEKIQMIKDTVFPWDIRAYLFILKGMGFYKDIERPYPEMDAIYDEYVATANAKAEAYADNTVALMKIFEGT
jgi:flavin-dependent dehydrogenase